MHRRVTLFNELPYLKVDQKKISQLIFLLDARHKPQNQGELSIAFVRQNRLAKMHADFCGDPSPTDVITFPAFQKGAFGEICISPQAAIDYSKNHKVSKSDELRRYVIHGYLHLLGYDDKKLKFRIKMKQQEAILLKLGKQITRIFAWRK